MSQVVMMNLFCKEWALLGDWQASTLQVRLTRLR